MTGEQIQDLTYAWLEVNRPKGIDWQSPVDLNLGMAIEIKMIAALDQLEYNMDNGGWAQVLWNCHGQWRQLLDIASEGYKLIGALPQAAAIGALRELCEQYESECAATLAADDDSLDGFAEFTSRSYSNGPDWQELFWHRSGAYEKRLDWLEQNESRVRKAVGFLEH